MHSRKQKTSIVRKCGSGIMRTSAREILRKYPLSVCALVQRGLLPIWYEIQEKFFTSLSPTILSSDALSETTVSIGSEWYTDIPQPAHSISPNSGTIMVEPITFIDGSILANIQPNCQRVLRSNLEQPHRVVSKDQINTNER